MPNKKTKNNTLKGKEPSEDKVTELTAETQEQHDVSQGDSPYMSKEEKLKMQYANM